MDQDDIPGRKSPFISRSDDMDNLWKVHEITQESDTQYKVRWVGTDPQTGKPWAQSWVPKSDCTDDLVLKWEAKRGPGKQDGSVVRQPPLRPKRKRQPEEDTITGSTEVLGKATAKAESGKKQKQKIDKDAPLGATPFETRPLVKIGPPRGVHRRYPTHSQPFSSGPSPAVTGRLSGGSARPTDKTEKGPANRPSEQRPSTPKRQLSSDDGTLPKVQPNRRTGAIVSPRKLSSASNGAPEPSEMALGEYKAKFTKIAANILTLHGLVKKVDVQLEEAMRELRELEASFQ